MTTLTTSQPPRTAAPSLLDELLQQQQQLTAVDKFSQFHQKATVPLLESHYRALIPATPPAPGQQYAFEVSLDDCSGCKACVAACHNLNGLEDDELWRSVGLLHGGAPAAPMQQHVTTACHHCIEPGCLSGCPVKAYDKDPVTGIVRHLDDQCIGCQYCILMCPYEVPQYSSAKGIVRKCDMCSNRLAVGEAPACVQACPHEAIRITTVDTESVAAESVTAPFLPGAPDPTITLPTTRYHSAQQFPRNTVPADYFTPRSQHAHWPLIVMLVLTQMSVGALAAVWLLSTLQGAGVTDLAAEAIRIATALAIGMLGMGAAVFHLGRPVYAFRALLGLRTSWMSREILAFNLFAGAATGYLLVAVMRWLGWDMSPLWETVLGMATVLSGGGAIFCSAMIYVATHKPYWGLNRTAGKFYLSAAVLGASTTLLLSLLPFSERVDSAPVLLGLNAAVAFFAALKLLLEGSIYVHLFDKRYTALRRSAILISQPQRGVMVVRYACGLIGGVLLPLVLLATIAGGTPSASAVLAGVSLAMLLSGEIAERYLFFTAVAAAKMPGAPVA